MGKGRFLVALLLMFTGQPVSAQQVPVDLELLLAADTSISMDENDRTLQLEGYAGAFRDPEVVSAILSGPHRRIAVSYVEWSSDQRIIVPWTVLQSKADAAKFADAIAEIPTKSGYGGTNITGAIEFGTLMVSENEFAGSRRVIDISGDGMNNSGRLPDDARDKAVRQGITINGLPLNENDEDSSVHSNVRLDVYYREHVIGGLGAFLVIAEDPQDFARAIKLKLLREIAAR
jgi:hypothetical protein